MFLETLWCNCAQPENADWNFVLRAAKQTEIFRAHDWLRADHSSFAEPILEDFRESRGQLRTVVSGRRTLAERKKWITIFWNSRCLSKSAGNTLDRFDRVLTHFVRIRAHG